MSEQQYYNKYAVRIAIDLAKGSTFSLEALEMAFAFDFLKDLVVTKLDKRVWYDYQNKWDNLCAMFDEGFGQRIITKEWFDNTFSAMKEE